MLAVSHQNVVEIYSVDDDPVSGGVVIRMEYHQAGSLASVYGGEPGPVDRVVKHVERACRGLQHLHAAGLLHRDIKPANVLVADDGVATLSDFGLSRPVHDVGIGPAIGYLAHLPPEALAGPGEITSTAGDVFAMGVTLYRLLEGDGLLESMRGSGVDVQQEILAGRFPPKAFSPHVHDRLRRVVRKATRMSPGDRYATAAQMRHALEAARPVVSWAVHSAGGGGLVWDGLNVPGGTEYHARLAEQPDGMWSFWIEKRLPGRALRRQHALGIESVSRAAALRHAQGVLGRLAQPA